MSDFKNKYLKKLRIGSIQLESNVLAAPLAGYTCYPFRIMCRRLGAALAFTEMVSANGLKYNDNATKRLLFTTDSEYPKAVQLLGSEPAVFEHTCRGDHIERFDIIDINMGCPVPNVIKSGAGCALMNDLPRASEIIKACKRSGKPVTVKCRAGMSSDKINIVEFAKMCEESGADMITVHGRTRSMMYDGEPLYEQIAETKAFVKIPLIANGGINSAEDAVKMMEKTDADGVMLGRYGFENPLVFSRLTELDTMETKCSLLLSQLKFTSECFDEQFTLTYIKKLASYFMKKQPGTKRYKQALYACGNSEQLKAVIKEIFPKG